MQLCKLSMDDIHDQDGTHDQDQHALLLEGMQLLLKS